MTDLRQCKLCVEQGRVREAPTFDNSTDEDLIALLEHYGKEHPASDLLDAVLADVSVKRSCAGCDETFDATVTTSSVPSNPGFYADSYCPDCSEGSANRIYVGRIEAEQVFKADQGVGTDASA